MRSNVLSESLKPWLHSAKYRAECGIISRRPRYVPGRIMTHLVASNCWTGCLIAGCLVFMRICLMNIVNMTHSGRLEKSTATKTGSWFQHHKSDLHKQGFVYGLMRVSSNQKTCGSEKEGRKPCLQNCKIQGWHYNLWHKNIRRVWEPWWRAKKTTHKKESECSLIQWMLYKRKQRCLQRIATHGDIFVLVG